MTASRSSTTIDVYDEDASVVLVGLTGAGKKTLAVIAAISLGRKYIDFEEFFEQQTGSSLASHLRSNGIDSHHTTVYITASRLLMDFGKDHIIGGFSEIIGRGYQDFFMQVKRNNPVIYIRRDKDILRNFVSSEDAKFDRWYKACDILHACCASQIGRAHV